MVDSRIALVIHPSLHFPNAQIGITVVHLSLLTRVHAARGKLRNRAILRARKRKLINCLAKVLYYTYAQVKPVMKLRESINQSP